MAVLQSAIQQLAQFEQRLTRRDAVEELPLGSRQMLASEAAEIAELRHS